MDKDEFIEAINIQVHQTAITGIRMILDKPPGRKPDEELVELSSWFKDLSDADKEMVMKVAKEASISATFGFLCIFDGVRVIEDGPNKGGLKLYYKKGLRKVLLNDHKGEYLHDMFNQLLFHNKNIDDG